MKNTGFIDSNPLISFVIPTWNRESEVIRALDSLTPLLQEDFPFEVVVTDNASTDNTVDFVRGWSAEHSLATKVITSMHNEGPVTNWIKGINCACGHYILLLFSDDFIRFTSKQQVRAFFEELEKAKEFNINIIRLPVQIVNNQLEPSPSKLLSLPYHEGTANGSFSAYTSKTDFLVNHLLPRKLTLGSLKRTFSPVSPCGYVISRSEILSTLEKYSDRRMYKTNGAGIDQLSILCAARNSKTVAMFAEPISIMVASPTSITHTSKSSSKKVNNLLYSYHLSELDFAAESLVQTRRPLYLLFLVMGLLRIFKTSIARYFQS